MGPIGVLLTTVLLECYFQKIECKAIMEALTYKIAPKAFRRFVDESVFKRGHTQISF